MNEQTDHYCEHSGVKLDGDAPMKKLDEWEVEAKELSKENLMYRPAPYYISRVRCLISIVRKQQNLLRAVFTGQRMFGETPKELVQDIQNALNEVEEMLK